jgi:uncharacterized membrane protein (DUF441 family)
LLKITLIYEVIGFYMKADFIVVVKLPYSMKLLNYLHSRGIKLGIIILDCDWLLVESQSFLHHYLVA